MHSPRLAGLIRLLGMALITMACSCKPTGTIEQSPDDLKARDQLVEMAKSATEIELGMYVGKQYVVGVLGYDERSKLFDWLRQIERVDLRTKRMELGAISITTSSDKVGWYVLTGFKDDCYLNVPGSGHWRGSDVKTLVDLAKIAGKPTAN